MTRSSGYPEVRNLRLCSESKPFKVVTVVADPTTTVPCSDFRKQLIERLSNLSHL